jgi:hypothetical protein
MRRPRGSIGVLMTVVLLVAINLLLVRDRINNPHSSGFVAPGILPMVTVLAAFAFIDFFELCIRDRVSSFRIGFQVFGWGSILLLAIFDFNNYKFYDRILLVIPWNINYFQMIAYVLIYSVPPFLFAFVGGWLAKKFGLMLTVGRPNKPDAASTKS